MAALSEALCCWLWLAESLAASLATRLLLAELLAQTLLLWEVATDILADSLALSEPWANWLSSLLMDTMAELLSYSE